MAVYSYLVVYSTHRGVSINVFWSNLNIFLFSHSQNKRCSSQKSVLSGIRYKGTCGAKRWHSRVASAVQAKRSTKRSNKRRACGCVVSVAKCSTSSRQSGATRSVTMTTAKRSETTHYHRAQASACQRKQCTPYTERRSLRYVIRHLQQGVAVDMVFLGVFGLKGIASMTKQLGGLSLRPVGYILLFCFVYVAR